MDPFKPLAHGRVAATPRRAEAWHQSPFRLNTRLNSKLMAIYIYETIPKNPKGKPRRFEVEQKMSAAPLKTDPQTGLPVRRVITGGSGLVTHGASILSMKVPRSRR